MFSPAGEGVCVLGSMGAQPRMSLAAFPPAPIEAMFSFSFGDLYPSALSDPELLNPRAGTAPASRDPKKKCRRENESNAIDVGTPADDSNRIWSYQLSATDYQLCALYRTLQEA